MNAVVLLTGATGFLGTYLAEAFCRTTEVQIIALVHAASKQAAMQRLQRAWWDQPELAQQIGKRINVVAGDITCSNLNLVEGEYQQLVASVTHIVHAAADLRLQAPMEQLRLVNVTGTENMLHLAQCIHRHHGLQRFSHVSTAYVAGKRQGYVSESDLTNAFGFSNAYEQSKYEAEKVVHAAGSEMPVSVFRPGMVVGHSRTGTIKTFNTFYYPLRLFLTGRYRFIPAAPALRLNMVPVDYVADAITRLTMAPEAEGATFHLTAPGDMLPTVAELLYAVRTWAAEHLQVQLPKPVFLPIPALGRLRILAGYLRENRSYARDNVDRMCGPYPHEWRHMLPQLLAYATHHGFLHRSERTVHEQLFFRLGSKSRPVRFGDIVGNRVCQITAVEMRQEITTIIKALSASGVKPGDLVAITGLNSSRHVAINTAIGLLGAVSVPLYYTSPPAEIAAIVADCGAKLLLVGSPKMLPQLSDLATKLPVISFCPGDLPKGAEGVVDWDVFVRRGATHSVDFDAGRTLNSLEVHPLPDDPATVCYTSGTTGAPKGVVFTHRQLRWMAEQVAALPAWHARNKTIRYLSFLPMSHVVEGILGAYAPFFAPASLRLFYLADFAQLPVALRQAQPTFFFSVPRFYEKLWAQATQNSLVRRAIAGKVASGVLSRLLGRMVLRRAGLHRCGYLVVGSAPVSEQLLAHLASLGITVHNAYGLTEAPLITINRPRSNLAHTVGTPLPETQLSISFTGEIFARGPQVALRYYGSAQSKRLMEDGWLCTGDFGHLTADGHLVVEGRKKDIIITAYGKNIVPGKIETMLRSLPGVVEALLVGERQPYCTAILWLNPKLPQVDWTVFDSQILAMNTQLSHPEQVKKWLVLPYDLSVETGELTANLKLRREVVERKLARQIAWLYESGTESGKQDLMGFYAGKAGA